MRQAVAIYRQQGDRWQLSNALAVLANAVGGDEPRLAAGACRELLALVEQSGMVDQLANATTSIAWLALRNGLTDSAAGLAARAVPMAERFRYWSIEGDRVVAELQALVGGRPGPVPSFAQVVRDAWACLETIEASLSTGEA